MTPAACLEAARLAFAFRAQFQQDFMIDLIGYRRYGHNEGDEPGFTQPLMYDIIRSHPTVRAVWADTLAARGILITLGRPTKWCSSASPGCNRSTKICSPKKI